MRRFIPRFILFLAVLLAVSAAYDAISSVPLVAVKPDNALMDLTDFDFKHEKCAFTRSTGSITAPFFTRLVNPG